MTNASVAPVVLVTGARGFIGGAAALQLAGQGLRVRAGQRGARAANGGGPNLVPAACDLDRPEETRAAVAGASLVVHTAYGDIGAMPKQFTTLLSAMTKENARNFIALSSIAVYGDREGRIDEFAAPGGGLDGYARAKLECESLARAWAEEAPDRRVLIVRPGIVYGAGSRFWIDKLVERIRLGAWGEFGPQGEGLAALIHVDDLCALLGAAAKALLSQARTTWPAVEIWNAVGPETPTWNAYFQALAESIGAPRLAPLSKGAIARRQALAVPAKIWRRFGWPGGRAAALAPMPGELALFSRRATYVMERAAQRVDCSAHIGLADGLARTFAGSRRS